MFISRLSLWYYAIDYNPTVIVTGVILFFTISLRRNTQQQSQNMNCDFFHGLLKRCNAVKRSVSSTEIVFSVFVMKHESLALQG